PFVRNSVSRPPPPRNRVSRRPVPKQSLGTRTQSCLSLRAGRYDVLQSHRIRTLVGARRPMSAPSKSVVIVGGGFAGVYTARHLQRRLPDGWEIILFSRENHFIFTPLLGDVAGSSINPMHVVWPIRQMARYATCRTAELSQIDLAGRTVHYKLPDG